MKDLTDLDYKDLFRDAVNMMAHIARAAGFDPADPTVEPPAIVARVESLRAEVKRLRAEQTDLLAPVEEVDLEAVLELDADAPPAPWDQAWPTCVTTGGRHGDVIADGCPEEAAELIVCYRTAAPALAREVIRLRAAHPSTPPAQDPA